MSYRLVYDEIMKGSPDLSVAQLALAEERLRHPRPGSRIAEAQQYGVDLSLLIENLRLTPAERASRMHDVIATVDQVRGAVRRRSE
jgi:hypothetical protein